MKLTIWQQGVEMRNMIILMRRKASNCVSLSGKLLPRCKTQLIQYRVSWIAKLIIFYNSISFGNKFHNSCKLVSCENAMFEKECRVHRFFFLTPRCIRCSSLLWCPIYTLLGVDVFCLLSFVLLLFVQFEFLRWGCEISIRTFLIQIQ